MSLESQRASFHLHFPTWVSSFPRRSSLLVTNNGQQCLLRAPLTHREGEAGQTALRAPSEQMAGVHGPTAALCNSTRSPRENARPSPVLFLRDCTDLEFYSFLSCFLLGVKRSRCWEDLPGICSADFILQTPPGARGHSTSTCPGVCPQRRGPLTVPNPDLLKAAKSWSPFCPLRAYVSADLLPDKNAQGNVAMFLIAVEKTISETDQNSHYNGLESWHTELRHPSPPGQQRWARCHALRRQKLGLAPQPPSLIASNQPTIWEWIWTCRLKFPGSAGSEDVEDRQLALFFPAAAASRSYKMSPRFHE